MAAVDKENESELPVFVHRIASAELCIDEKDYSTALNNYFEALQFLKPFQSLKVSLKTKFAFAFQERCAELESSGKYDELFDCFRQLGEIFPECEVAINTMGTFLFRLGMIEEAACCFRQALKQDTNFLGARENLENASSHLVERWHFRMLNDQERNAGFSNAITKAMTEGHSLVLDIGSGTGLLSMFAVLAGAESVHACEMSKSMVEMSRDILAANRMAEEITLFHKRSDELVIGEDLPQWVDLVVTETVDGGLLGEHILETVHDAWERLLIPYEAGGRAIPGRAKVFACGIECLAIRKQNRLLYPTLPHLDIDGLQIVSDVGFHDVTSTRTSGDADRDVDTTSNDDVVEESEPYTTENLRIVSGGYKQLTAAYQILDIDFNDRERVASMMTGSSASFTFEVTRRGRLDALVLWFDLDLDDEHSLSTSPYQVSCWDQAIYPVLHQHLLHKGKHGENFMLRPGENLHVSMVTKSDQIKLRCSAVDRGSMDIDNITQSLASISSRETTDQSDLSNQNCNIASDVRVSIDESERWKSSRDLSTDQSDAGTKSRDIFTLDRRHIESLNDLDYNTTYCKAIQNYCQNGKNIIVSTQGLPILGLQALKLGARKIIMSNVPEHYQDLLNRLAEINDLRKLNEINNDQNQTITNSELKEENGNYFDCVDGATDLSNAVASDVRGYVYGGTDYDVYGLDFDVLVCDVVDPCGALRQQVLEDIAIMRLTCLRAGGRVIPSVVQVQAVLINSQQLREHSRVVSDQRTLGLVIADYMNDFAMSIHVDIDLDTLPHTKLSTPFPLLALNLNEPCANTPCIPEYLQQNATLNCDVTETGDITAIVYWFDLDLDEGQRLCTLGQGHWKQAAVMVKEPVSVAKGDSVIVDVRLKDSCFDVKIKLADC